MKNMSDCVYPCPCGWANDPQKPCTCAPAVVAKYQKRISGPLLDRIDIHVEVPRVEYQKLSNDRLGETSAVIRQRVQAARDIQRKRFSNVDSSNIICNADMRAEESGHFGKLDEERERRTCAAMRQMNSSERGNHRVIKLARTIADLAVSKNIQAADIDEALQYRPKVLSEIRM